jgi:hypothetical protein
VVDAFTVDVFFVVVFFIGVSFTVFSFFAGFSSFLAPNFGFGPLAIISRQSLIVSAVASFPPFGIL